MAYKQYSKPHVKKRPPFLSKHWSLKFLWRQFQEKDKNSNRSISSGTEVREKLDLGFLGGVGQSFFASHFLEGPLGSNKSCNITFVLFCFAFQNSDEKICSGSFD